MRAATCRISQGVERRQQREASFLLLVSLFRRLQGHAWSGRQGRAPPDESRHAHGEREKGQARIPRRMSFASGWTRSRLVDWKKGNISPPSFDRRDHAGSAERCRVLTTVTATRSFSWTWQIRNPIAPTQVRSTTRRRDSAYFTAIRMSAKRSSSIAPLHLDFVRRAIEPGNIRRTTSRTARSTPSPTWAPRQPI